MLAIQPVGTSVSPSASVGTGSDRADTTAAVRGSEPAQAPETARPVGAPENAAKTDAYSSDRRTAEGPARAEPKSVVQARVPDDEPAVSEERPVDAPEAFEPSSEVEPMPDPMIPPVPMKYLAELIRPQAAPGEPVDVLS